MFSANSIEHTQQKSRKGQDYKRSSDGFNIISGQDDSGSGRPDSAKSNRSNGAPQEVDIITGLPKSASSSSLNHHRKSASRDDDEDVDWLSGKPKEKHEIHRRVSVKKEFQNDIEDDVDPITLLKKKHSESRLPQRGVKETIEGIFEDFLLVDDISIQCPKCKGVLYIDAMYMPKGAYVTGKAAYNVKGTTHEQCFFHPRAKSVSGGKNLDYALFKCCGGTLQSAGCQLQD